MELRQLGDDVLADAVGEVFLLGITAHVPERQHQRAHVLDLALAAVDEREREPVPDRTLHRIRDGDATGRGETLEPGREIDAVAVDGPVGFLDHVTEMHADAKPHPVAESNSASTESTAMSMTGRSGRG